MVSSLVVVSDGFDRTLLQSAKSAWNRLPSASASAVRDRGVECPLGPRLAPGRSTSGQLDTTLLLLHHHRYHYQVTQVRVYNPSQVKSSHERRAPYLFLAALRTRISSVLVIALYLSLQLALVSLFMANRSLYKATASRDSFRTLSSSCDSLLGVTDIVICQFPAKPKLSKISHQIALFVSLASVWVRCRGEILQNCGFRIFLRGEAELILFGSS